MSCVGLMYATLLQQNTITNVNRLHVIEIAVLRFKIAKVIYSLAND